MRKVIISLWMIVIVTGCGSRDDRLAHFAAQSNQQQSEQNQAMARVSREAAETTRRAIESEKESREKLLTLHQDLQTQRSQLDTDRRELHLEQQQIAEAQRWDSKLGPVLYTIGMLIVCSLPLVLCWKLLSGLSSDPQEERIAAVLIDEIVAETGPLRLPAPPEQVCLPASHGSSSKSTDSL